MRKTERGGSGGKKTYHGTLVYQTRSCKVTHSLSQTFLSGAFFSFSSIYPHILSCHTIKEGGGGSGGRTLSTIPVIVEEDRHIIQQ